MELEAVAGGIWKIKEQVITSNIKHHKTRYIEVR